MALGTRYKRNDTLKQTKTVFHRMDLFGAAANLGIEVSAGDGECNPDYFCMLEAKIGESWETQKEAIGSEAGEKKNTCLGHSFADEAAHEKELEAMQEAGEQRYAQEILGDEAGE